MALIKPDFSEAVSSAPIPPGSYNARIMDVEQKTGKTSGAPYLNWKLEVVGAKDTTLNGRVFFHMTMLTGKAAGQIKTFHKAVLGSDLADGAQFDTDLFLGKTVSVVLKEGRDQQGNVRDFPEVARVMPQNPALTAAGQSTAPF